MAAKKERETVRLTNINSGAVVSTSPEVAAKLGSEWSSSSSKTSAAKKSAATTDDK